MKERQSCRFECHEYTWSEQGVAGYPVGWRIKASSRENDRVLLSRIEKAAACASVDSQGRVAVEELLYESSIGFIKMVAEPAVPGKDHRKNIRVRLYHSENRYAEPQNYLAPHDQWPQGGGTSLSGITIDPISLSRSEILEKYHLQGTSLASFIDRAFSCIGRKRGICFGSTDWEEGQFAAQAAQVMLAVHLLLPQKARKYAGYLSFSRESRENVPFYFQPVQRMTRENREIFLLPASQAGMKEDSAEGIISFESPWQYMCFHLSRLLDSRKTEDYDEFLSRLNEQMTEEREEASSDFVRTIPWIFYFYFRDKGGAAMENRILIRAVPQLCYWKAGGLIDKAILDFVMKEIRDLDLSEKDLQFYLQELAAGMTSRTRQDMIPEMARVLEQMEKINPETCAKERDRLKEEYKDIARELGMMKAGKTVRPRPYEKPWFNMLGSLPMDRAQTQKDRSSGGKPGESLSSWEEEEAELKETVLPAEIRRLSQEEGLEDYRSFLVNSMPRGFLTGCMLFLSIYSIKIGHGKIALGMAGVWMIVMLNDQRVILEKKLPYPLWMILGLSLVEGLLISTTAWLLPARKVRLLFFLFVGMITLLSQMITILRIVRKDK